MKYAVTATKIAKMPSDARWQVWQSIFWAKAVYGNAYLSQISKRKGEQMIKFIYQSITVLLELRSKVKKEDLIQFGMGMNGDKFLQLFQKKIEVNLSPPQIMKKTEYMQLKSAKFLLKKWTKAEVPAYVEARFHMLVKPYSYKVPRRVCKCSTIAT